MCVVVLLTVTLTVPVHTFPVHGGEGGPMECWDGWMCREGTGMDVWMDDEDRSGWMDEWMEIGVDG